MTSNSKWGSLLWLALSVKHLLGHLRRRLDDQLVLVGVYPLLELMQILPFPALDLTDQDGLASVNLVNDIVHHDARPVPLQFARLEVLKRPLNRIRPIVFPFLISQSTRRRASSVSRGCGVHTWQGGMQVDDLNTGRV